MLAVLPGNSFRNWVECLARPKAGERVPPRHLSQKNETHGRRRSTSCLLQRVYSLPLRGEPAFERFVAAKSREGRPTVQVMKTASLPQDRNAERPLSLGRCFVDFAQNRIVLQDGQSHRISSLQAAILKYLAAHRGEAVTRDELLANVWKIDSRNTLTRTVDVHISQLRRKLGDDPHNPRMLVTAHGHGYRLTEAEEQAAGKGPEE